MDNYDLNTIKISLEELYQNITKLSNELAENRLMLKNIYNEHIEDLFISSEVRLETLSGKLSNLLDIIIPEKIEEKSTEEKNNGNDSKL